MAKREHPERAMSRHTDRAIPKSFAAKAIYGLITALTVLQAMKEHPPTALQATATVFGAILAVALLDAYAESVATILAERRGISRAELREIWHEVRPVLIGAQAPTIVLLICAAGRFSVERAITIAEVIIFVNLFAYGWRIGQLLHTSRTRQLLSSLILVGIGALIVAIKVAFH